MIIPSSYIAPIPVIYAGGVILNRVRDFEREHGCRATWRVMPDGAVEIVRT